MAEATTRLSGALAGHYRIERELGTGGMATVYRGHDLKHDRDVAIKVLHPDLGAALGGERFLSEIRTTARLQHPHILPLLDSGDAGGLLYYVMPVVTGESLRARLARERQLPIPEAVRIAREVASALDYAHRQGVIHRDIKPENILLHDGQALVADFGIALAVQQAGGQRMTQTGLSLGTPQYMSPEQAMGERTIDARTDVYALGAVTYEMLVGEPPFTGPTVQTIVAKVLSERPIAPHTLRDTVPAVVESAVLTALAKLPADRHATAAEFARALTEHTPAMPDAQRVSVAPRRRGRDPLVLSLGAAAVAFAGIAATLATRVGRSAPDPFPVRAEITLDAEGPIGPGVLSPDGRSVVFSGGARARPRGYYLRRLDQLTSREIPGTENSSRSPAFSPDGKWIAFVQGRRRMVKVPLEGGAPVTLADVADYGGVDWSARGEIIFGPGIDEGLQGLLRINEAGGRVTPFTRVDTARKELSHQSPRILADGSTVLFTIWFGSIERAELAVTSLDDGAVVPLGILGVTPLGVVDGRLVYLNSDGLVMAVPFDLRTRRTSGTPMVVQDGIRFQGGGGSDHEEVSMTHDGGLVYHHGNVNRRLVWVDRNGRSSPAADGVREFAHVRLAPNGRQAALTIITGSKRDIWTLDLADGTLTRLTTTGTSRNPMWSTDGRRILYASTHSGRGGFWWQPADGSGPAQLAVDPRRNPWFADLSPDNRSVVFNAIATANFDLTTASLDSARHLRELSASPTAIEAMGRFSPDGRWVAYNSDETGRPEVYVRLFAGTSGRMLISTNGGQRPVWSADGRRLFYWEGNRMIEATFASEPTPRVVSRQSLFEGRYELDYDVARDGRFLMIEAETSGLTLVVIPNWRTELRRLTGGAGR
jgi:Tol biopolymer transport system component